ncbi:RusA family crossover junction endodeoxyribonuclease [Planktothrix paucivesiculata]|nr:RusA family crossover junction endodeoxyribonuclease [Planktothrix paucivesiculata]
MNQPFYPHSDSVTSPFLSMGEIFYRSPVALQNFYLMLSTYLQVLSDSQPPLPTLDDFAQRINQEHKQCLDAPQTSLIHARNAGEWLLHVQGQLSPEHWQVWFQEHFTFSQQTATMYMQIARKMPGVNPGIFSLAMDSKSEPTKTLVIPILPYSQAKNLTDEVENSSEKSPQVLSLEPELPLLNTQTRRGSSLPESEIILSESTPTIPEELEVLESPVTRIQINPTESSIDVEFTAINPPETPPIDLPKPPKKSAEIIKLMIPGVVVPKARPRVTRNGTYLPPRYRAWRNHAEVEIYRQISEQNITHKFPLRKAAIVIKLFGNHRTNSDIDNLAGACLDALTLNGAGVLIDDRLSCLPQLTVEFDPDAKKTGVSIEIEPL